VSRRRQELYAGSPAEGTPIFAYGSDTTMEVRDGQNFYHCNLSFSEVKGKRAKLVDTFFTSDVAAPSSKIESELRRYIKYDVTRYSIDTSALQRNSRYISVTSRSTGPRCGQRYIRCYTSDTADTARVTPLLQRALQHKWCAMRKGVGS
jgi:hypothetical protein